MEWWLTLIVVFGSLILIMISGLPIAFSFMLVNVVGIYLWFGGTAGLGQFISSMFSALTTFTLLPLPLFILMGEVMFHSGIAPNMIDALDKWLGRLHGRLSLEAVLAGTVLSTLSGNSMASVAVLGSTLVPEMQKRGYKKPMSIGPILGSGGLSIMIPPSGLAVLLGWLGKISIGKLLIAIIIPGLVMAVLYISYIIIRSRLQPHLAPSYEVPPIPLFKKVTATARYILPIGLIIFLVVGVIFLGVTTPSEAAATGALGTFLLAAIYGKLSWQVVKKSFSSALAVITMIFMIMAGAVAFSQILAFTGATRGLAELIIGLPVIPLFIIIAMQVILLFLGMFITQSAVMMITLPIFMPIVNGLGLNPLWFSVIYLLNMEMATTTPPFGLSLFVMKGVAPTGTTTGDIYRAALPFLGCDLVAMALIIAFPSISIWLPGIMR